jgi:predicted nucleic acid-binding protein
MENTRISENAKKLRFKRIIIDNSVLLKTVFEEEDSSFVRQIVALHMEKQLTLLAPPVLYFEFLNALSKNIKDTEQVKLTLKKYFKFGIAIIDATYGYLEEGIKAACENKDVSYYDSSYHSLAKDMNGIFLTADKKYYDVMKNEGHIALLANLVK